MCRLTAYIGPKIALERIVTKPAHSLLDQSQDATEAKLSVNGDGFGIAWYGDEAEPGLYRDVLPAWSDGNLTSLCRVVKSHLFLAHVRASTVGEVSRTNCHPFTYGRWSFAHNGQIGGFTQIRRALESQLPDTLYNHRRGTTDSELFFLLCLSNGLDENPQKAIQTTLRSIEALQSETTEPNRLACILSNGASVFGFRMSSDNTCPTLYRSKSLCAGGVALASEPLDGDHQNWTALKRGTLVQLNLDLPKAETIGLA